MSRPLLDALGKSKLDDQPKQAPKQHKRSSERFELLRNDVAAVLADELQGRKRAEADTREAQAALKVEVEGRHKKGGTRMSATSSILRCCCC